MYEGRISEIPAPFSFSFIFGPKALYTGIADDKTKTTVIKIWIIFFFVLEYILSGLDTVKGNVPNIILY